MNQVLTLLIFRWGSPWSKQSKHGILAATNHQTGRRLWILSDSEYQYH